MTLDQAATWLIRLAAVIAALGALYKALVYCLNKILESKFDEINTKVVNAIDDLSKKIEQNDYNSCKNFIVQIISEIDRGVEISETTLERFYEEYDHYVNDCDGNGYIKAKVAALERDGKLSRLL